MRKMDHKIENGQELKWCPNCNDRTGCWKPLLSFGKNCRTKDGLYNICRECKIIMDRIYYEKNREVIREKQTDYYQETAEDRHAYMKIYCKENKKEISERRIIRRLVDLERAKRRERILSKRYRNKNRKEINEKSEIRRKKKWEESIEFRLNCNMSSAINASLKKRGGNKNGYHWETLVPYNKVKLEEHFETLFSEKMSWEYYGRSCGKGIWWEIDHIIP